MAGEYDPMIPVFIGGTGRSGTTIIKRALTARREFIGFKSELRIIVDPDGVLDLMDALDEHWSPYKGDVALKRFRALLRKVRTSSFGNRALRRALYAANISPPNYLALGLENDTRPGAVLDIFEPVLNELSYGTSPGSWIGSPGGLMPPEILETRRCPRSRSVHLLASAVRSLYGQLPGAADAIAFVEDTPFNILHSRELFELFPDMYLLNVYRDPRDIVASYMGKDWGGKDIRFTSQRIRAVLDRWAEVRDDLPGDRVFDISLEDLAADPSKTLSPFFKVMNIAPDGMENIISVEKANIGRWRKNLTAEQVCVVEEIFSPEGAGVARDTQGVD